MLSLKVSKDRPIAVMGLSRTGEIAARALQAAGAHVLAWDDDKVKREQESLSGLIHDLKSADWKNIQSLVLSPGIPHTLPAPHPVTTLARQNNVEIISDIELLFRNADGAKIIGITGTNGKSTTTSLLGHMLALTGKKTRTGGNLGTPVMAFDPAGPDGFYVIETSSFQAEITPSAAFDVVVWLNITPDHLDRHGDMAGYVAAKKKMLRDAGKAQTLVIGVDDDYSRAVAGDMEKAGHWQVVRISAEKILPQGVSGVDGALYVDGRKALSLEKAQTLPGKHNAQNAAAVLAVARVLGLDDGLIQRGIDTFPGLPHRQELVRRIGGVHYINDSKATNADATSKALACYSNMYWIIGGKAKDGGLDGLESYMPQVRHAFLIGASSDAFAKWCEGKIPYTLCGTLEKAVQAAHAVAQKEKLPEAVVLLSPACASFDQFKSYEHRGEEFCRLVRALPET
jgi:UDP-N-acetylmuramoylalanine--D-glutamate ligase